MLYKNDKKYLLFSPISPFKQNLDIGLSTLKNDAWKTNPEQILKEIKDYSTKSARKFCTYLH